MDPEGTPKVLVVGDNPDHNQALTQILELAGYHVTVVGDAQEALAVLTEQPSDVVVTDLRLPGVGGLDLLRCIRAINRNLPVVVTTRLGDWTTYMEAMGSGAVDYLSKPVQSDDILMTVRRALARRGVRPPDTLSSDSAEESDTAT